MTQEKMNLPNQKHLIPINESKRGEKRDTVHTLRETEILIQQLVSERGCWMVWPVSSICRKLRSSLTLRSRLAGDMLFFKANSPDDIETLKLGGQCRSLCVTIRFTCLMVLKRHI